MDQRGEDIKKVCSKYGFVLNGYDAIVQFVILSCRLEHVSITMLWYVPFEWYEKNLQDLNNVLKKEHERNVR